MNGKEGQEYSGENINPLLAPNVCVHSYVWHMCYYIVSMWPVVCTDIHVHV